MGAQTLASAWQQENDCRLRAVCCACFHPAARLLTDPAGDGSESKNFLILE
jgi:hypothetical protein